MEAKKVKRLILVGILLSVAGSVGGAVFAISQPDPYTERINKLIEQSATANLDVQTALCRSGLNKNACIQLEQKKREYTEKYGKVYVYDQARIDSQYDQRLQELSDSCKQGNTKDCEHLEASVYLRFGKRSSMQEDCTNGVQVACENVRNIDKYLPAGSN